MQFPLLVVGQDVIEEEGAFPNWNYQRPLALGDGIGTVAGKVEGTLNGRRGWTGVRLVCRDVGLLQARRLLPGCASSIILNLPA